MKAITLLAMIFLMSVSCTAFSQSKTYYHKEPTGAIFTNCEVPPAFGNDSVALQNYLREKLQDAIATTSGQIKAGIVIDTTGKVLCKWISNDSNFKISENRLDQVIDSLPNWSSGIQNGHKVTCTDVIVMNFNKKDLQVSYRMGRD